MELANYIEQVLDKISYGVISISYPLGGYIGNPIITKYVKGSLTKYEFINKIDEATRMTYDNAKTIANEIQKCYPEINIIYKVID